MMLALVLVLALAPSRDPDVVAGEAAYREQRWDDASVAFDAAWRRSGDPIYLYTRAQVERLAGRCEVAVGLYEQFLTTSPPSQAGAAARQYVEDCRGQLPSPPPPAIESSAAEAAPDVVPPTQPPARERGHDADRRWSRDPAAAVLVATGGAAMVIGGVLVGLAHSELAGSAEQPDDRSYGDTVAHARRLEIAGATLLPIGAALAIGGAIRWAVLARRSRTPRVELGVLGSTTNARGFGLSLRGSFGLPLARRR